MRDAANDRGVPDAKEEARHLVLGFDAGCSSCADIAGLIEERVGGRISVRNLRDPEVQRWRERALGVAAPWAPTLFEVKGDEVRAWVGAKMGLALGRRLGPRDTWRVMQILGDIGAGPRVESAIEDLALVDKLPEKAQDALAGISRGQFLKGVAGATVAATILSGGPLAPPVEAAKGKPSPYDIVKGRKMTGAELTNAARQMGSSIDVKNLVGLALATPAKVSAARPAGFMHTLRNGTLQRVIVFHQSSGRTISTLEYAAPPKSMAASRAIASQYEGERPVITKASEGGMLWRVVARRRPSNSARGNAALSDCPPVDSPPSDSICWRRRSVCVEAAAAGACFSGAVAAGGTCWGCYAAAAASLGVGAVGPSCVGCFGATGGAINNCCATWREVWVYACR